MEAITPDGFATRMRGIANSTDPETIHLHADLLLSDLLRQLGYGEGINIYETIQKWYS